MASKQEFLAGLPIFADLSEASLAAVAAVATEYAFEPNAIIAYQRDVASQLYIVKEGRLFAKSLDNRGIVRQEHTRPYPQGTYFNDVWLFNPSVHQATIKGTERGRLLIIEGPAFTQLLKDNPDIIDELAPRDDGDVRYGLSDEAWAEAWKLKLRPRSRSAGGAALLPEERLEFFARRSRWLLAAQMVLPVLLVIIGIITFAAMPPDTGLQRALKYGVPLLFSLSGFLWMALRIIDWQADYFLITNRHLTHHEFELRHFRIRLKKIPIGQVQTVEILRPSFLANLFNIGSARVTTAAMAGNVLFDNIDDPNAVKNVLERLTGLYRQVEAAQTQAVMRQSLEKHFSMASPLKPAEDEAAAPVRRQARPGFWMRMSKRYGWRVVEGNAITYRKSIFILFKRVAIPTLVYILLGVLLGAGVYLDMEPWVVLLIFGVGLLLNTGFFIWQFEDWRNDIFQLTDRFVIDFDRKPFGFGETRKQAAISNIQNVNATRPGFFPTLFNYGFVTVDTAGAPSDIVFDYVPNPELIQADIFQRLDEFRIQQRISEGKARRDEYALLLDVYRQAMEQQLIPQRTPTDMGEEVAP